MDPRNEAVLAYLEVERMASPETNTAWVIDGYSLSTHPDLCDRVKAINEAAGRAAVFRYLYGKPARISARSKFARGSNRLALGSCQPSAISFQSCEKCLSQ